jgi:hypothetical protein
MLFVQSYSKKGQKEANYDFLPTLSKFPILLLEHFGNVIFYQPIKYLDQLLGNSS